MEKLKKADFKNQIIALYIGIFLVNVGKFIINWIIKIGSSIAVIVAMSLISLASSTFFFGLIGYLFNFTKLPGPWWIYVIMIPAIILPIYLAYFEQVFGALNFIRKNALTYIKFL